MKLKPSAPSETILLHQTKGCIFPSFTTLIVLSLITLFVGADSAQPHASFFCDFIDSSDISSHLTMNWNSENCDEIMSICSYTGVRCSTDSLVISLSLRSQGISGTIPFSIGSLTDLVELDLSGNELFGVFPPSLLNLQFLERVELDDLGNVDLINKVSRRLDRGFRFDQSGGDAPIFGRRAGTKFVVDKSGDHGGLDNGYDRDTDDAYNEGSDDRFDFPPEVYYPTSLPSTSSTPTIYSATDGLIYCEQVTSEIVAGSSSGASGTADGIGTHAQFNSPIGITTNFRSGLALVVDGQNVIRVLSVNSWEVSSVFIKVGEDSPGRGPTNGSVDSVTETRLFSARDIAFSVDASYALLTARDDHSIYYFDVDSGYSGRMAGSGSTGHMDGEGTNALMNGPEGIAMASDDSFVVVCESYGHRIRMVDSRRMVSTVAGTGIAGLHNGIGTLAAFDSPRFVALSSSNRHAYLSENSNRIRKIVLSTSAVTTLAGSGIAGFSNGVGALAAFNDPQGVLLSSDESFLFVADMGNGRVRPVNTATGIVKTIDVTVGSPVGLAWLVQDNVILITDGANNRTLNMYGSCPSPTSSPTAYLSPDDGLVYCDEMTMSVFVGKGKAGFADGIGVDAAFDRPAGLRAHPHGLGYLIADYGNHKIRKVDVSNNAVKSFVGNDEAGTADGVGTNAQLNKPSDIAITSDGLYALSLCRGSNLVRYITLSTGMVTTITGNGASSTDGIGTSTSFYEPAGIALSTSDEFALITEYGANSIRKLVLSSFRVTTLVGYGAKVGTDGIGVHAALAEPFFITLASDDKIAFISEYSGNRIRKLVLSTLVVTTLAGSPTGVSGTGDGVGTNAFFSRPAGMVLSSDNNVIMIADWTNNCIRRLSLSTNTVSTLTGTALASPVGIAWLVQDSILLLTESDGHRISQVHGTCAVPTSAPSSSVPSFYAAEGLYCDITLHMVVKDEDVGGGGALNSPYDIALDPSGAVALVTDYGSHAIFTLHIANGTVNTLAGSSSSTASPGSANGVGTSAQFDRPTGISVSSDGRFAVIVEEAGFIRHIALFTASVTTLAGSGEQGFADGVGNIAAFASPRGIVLSSSNTFALIADWGNHRIRKIIMSSNTVTTVAGNGNPAYADGPGISAEFQETNFIALSSDDAYAYVSEAAGNRIRKVVVSSGFVSLVAGAPEGAAGTIDGKGVNAKFDYPAGVAISLDDTVLYVVDSGGAAIRRVFISTGVVSSLSNESMKPFGLTWLVPDSVLLLAYKNNHTIKKVYGKCSSPTSVPTSTSPSVISIFVPTSAPSYIPSNAPSSDYGSVENAFLCDFIEATNISRVPTVTQNWACDDTANKCAWDGIVCNSAGRIESIYFENVAVSGTIPHSIGSLTALSSLTLQKLQLYGTLPESIGNLQSLTNLKIGFNGIIGPMPSTLNSLYNMIYLGLNTNQFSGVMPNLQALTALKYLSIGVNKMTGPLPKFSSKNLMTLNLYANSFTGTIPNHIGDLGKLTGLSLEANSLVGSVPLSFSKLVQLVELNLFNNNLVTVYPTALCGMTQLTTFYLTQRVNNECVEPTPVPTPTPSVFTAKDGLNCDLMVHAIIAGTGPGGATVDGVGTNAHFAVPHDVVVSHDRSFFLITDFGGHRVRRMNLASGLVSTFAGNGKAGSVNGVGTMASVQGPSGIAMSSDGLFAVSLCLIGNRVRYIVVSTAEVTTIAGNGVGSYLNGIGTMATFSKPTDIVLSSSDSFALISDTANRVIRKLVLSTRVVTTIAGSKLMGNTDGIATYAAFTSPFGITLSSDDVTAFISDFGGNRIRRLDMTTLTVSTVAGVSEGFLNGIGTNAMFNHPAGMTISSDDTLLFAVDYFNENIRRIDVTTNMVTTMNDNIELSTPYKNPRGLAWLDQDSVLLVTNDGNDAIQQLYGICPEPTLAPTTSKPTSAPTSSKPTSAPTSSMPTVITTAPLSSIPSGMPTLVPIGIPSEIPSGWPTALPSTHPSSCPSRQPSSSHPTPPGATIQPSLAPTPIPSGYPTAVPTVPPSLSHPTLVGETNNPTPLPTQHPTQMPTCAPTEVPTTSPANAPTPLPSIIPTAHPTFLPPTLHPILPGSTNFPTYRPTPAPSCAPTISPTRNPTLSPTHWSLPPPNVTSCQYHRDGSFVVLTLSGVSDKGFLRSPFLCDKLLTFDGASMSSCSWNSNGSVVNVIPSAMAEISLRDIFHLRSGVLRAACPLGHSFALCQQWPSSTGQNCQVRAPSNPIIPEVIIAAPNSIGDCNDLILDLSYSRGSGGRLWSYFAVNVTTTSLSYVPNITDIESFYMTKYAFAPPTPLPSTYLSTVTTYAFTVTLCNFFGKCNYGAHSVSVVNRDVPVLVIAGSPKRDLRVFHALALSSEAYVTKCDGTVVNSGVTYSWLVHEDGISLAMDSVANSMYRFRLKPFSLEVGHSYVIVAKAEYDISPVVSTAAVRVNVVPSAVVAVVRGATSRSLRYGYSLQIDASLSYDEDVFFVTGISAGLAFTWTCESYSNGVILPQCGLSITPNPLNAGVLTVEHLTANTSILSNVLLNVSNALSRFDTAIVEVTVLTASSPILQITTNASKVLVSSKVKLFATIESQSSFTAQWQINDRTIDLSEVALTPTAVAFASAGLFQFNLMLSAGILYPDGTFTFTLSTDGGSVAAITIAAIGPPIPGVFIVSPSSGYILKDIFTLAVSRWQDTELPLTYAFGYITPRNNTASLHSRSEVAFFSTKLGRTSANTAVSALRCTVTGYNILNAFTTLYFDVSIISDFPTIRDVNNLLEELNNDKSAQTDDVKRVVSVGISVLNAVNCSLAFECSNLHRHECLSTDYTCGPCLSGYVGEDGDANSTCFLAAIVIDSGVPTHCKQDEDCVHSQHCDNSTETCKIRQKICPHDCSGNGVCHHEAISTGLPVKLCSINNILCTAVCVCNEGFTGTACAITSSEIAERRDSRHSMIIALSNTSQFEDPSEDLVLEIVDMVAELASREYELTITDCKILEDLIHNLLFLANTLAMDHEGLKGVCDVLDTCASVFLRDQRDGTPVARRLMSDHTWSLVLPRKRVSADAYSPEDTSSSTSYVNTYSNLLEKYLDLVKQNSVVGQDPVYFIQRLSRSTISVSSAGTGSREIALPLTEVEKSIGTRPTYVSMSTASSSPSDAGLSRLSISVTQSLSRMYANTSSTDAIFNANPVRISVLQTGPTSNSTELDAVTFVFQTNQYFEYGAVTESNVTYRTICTLNDISWYNYSCPSGGRIAHKCTGEIGNITSRCPPVVVRPTCQLLVNDEPIDEAVVANACRLVSFNASTITCECTFPPITVAVGSHGGGAVLSRRTRGLDATEVSYESSGAMQVVSMATYSNDEFIDTIHDTENIRARDLRSAWLVIAMFAIFWGFGLVALTEDVWFTFTPATKEHIKQRHRSSAQSLVSGDIAHGVENSRRKYLMNYLDGIFPSVFTEAKPGFFGMWEELVKHHRYTHIFSSPGPAGRQVRARAILQMLTVQTMLMFLLALFYDLEYPTDNGKCKEYVTEAECLQDVSIFDRRKTLCTWRTNIDGVTGTCEYKSPQVPLRVVVLISILIACCTAPINLVVDFLFDDILSAPTADEYKLDLESNIDHTARMRGLGRRVSTAVGTAAVGAVKALTQNQHSKPLHTGKVSLGRKQSSLRLVTNDMTRVMPERVIHAHALACQALGQSLLEAFSHREAHGLGGGEAGSSSEPCVDIARCSSSVTPQGLGEIDSGSNGTNIESGMSRHFRRKKHRVQTIILKARSFANGIGFVPVTPDSEDFSLTRPVEDTMLGNSGLLQLLTDIENEYEAQPSDEREDFAEMWRFDPKGQCFLDTDLTVKHTLLCCGCRKRGDRAVSLELQAVRRYANMKYNKLQYARDIHTGLELMHLFICDLLGWGTTAQIIFETKTNEEFKHSLVVTNTAKILAWAAIIVLNTFFVYFAVIRAATREFAWQQGYVVACTIQLVVEIVLYESSEAVWIHYAIPRLVQGDVVKIMKRLYRTIDISFFKTTISTHKERSLDTPSYFFVSTQLAEKFPHLFESVIILSYHITSPPPGSLEGIRWKHNLYADDSDKIANSSKEGVISTASVVDELSWLHRCKECFRHFGLFAALALILQRLGTVHIRIQKVIIHTLQPLLVSLVILAGSNMLNNPLISGMVVVFIGINLAISVIMSRWQSKTHSTHAVNIAADGDCDCGDEESQHQRHPLVGNSVGEVCCNPTLSPSVPSSAVGHCVVNADVTSEETMSSHPVNTTSWTEGICNDSTSLELTGGDNRSQGVVYVVPATANLCAVGADQLCECDYNSDDSGSGGQNDEPEKDGLNIVDISSDDSNGPAAQEGMEAAYKIVSSSSDDGTNSDDDIKQLMVVESGSRNGLLRPNHQSWKRSESGSSSDDNGLSVVRAPSNVIRS